MESDFSMESEGWKMNTLGETHFKDLKIGERFFMPENDVWEYEKVGAGKARRRMMNKMYDVDAGAVVIQGMDFQAAIGRKNL
jgi:hypothetical protein